MIASADHSPRWKVAVTRREDPELLGGVVAKLGDTVYDGSLRTQLRTLRDELTK